MNHINPKPQTARGSLCILVFGVKGLGPRVRDQSMWLRALEFFLKASIIIQLRDVTGLGLSGLARNRAPPNTQI